MERVIKAEPKKPGTPLRFQFPGWGIAFSITPRPRAEKAVGDVTMNLST